MLKIKVFLVVAFLAGANFSASQALASSSSDVDSDEIPSSNYLSDVEKTTVKISEESEIPFQEELDMNVVVVYPPMDLIEEPETYTVVKGDNLSRIAKKHNISLDALMSWNDLRGDLIHPGDEFIVNGDPKDVKVVEFEPYENEPSKSAVGASPPAPPVSEKKKATTSTHAAETKKSTATVPVGGGAEMLVTATAYTAYCTGCSGTTAYGIDLRANPNQKVIAVDPKIIPLGTKVWVEGYGEAIAGDTGGAIKGNKIDVFIPSQESALAWGVKQVKIKVLN